VTLLERYLTLDTSEPTNAFSYATAWTWLSRRMGCILPTLEAYQSLPEYREINSEFLGFIYGRYGKVARGAVESVDKNHMLIGSRVNGNCPKDEGYLRAAGYYLDLITTNLYGGLHPDAETITNLYRYAGKPFIVTEFYAKAVDAIDANGYPLANSTGAGQLVKTQQKGKIMEVNKQFGFVVISLGKNTKVQDYYDYKPTPESKLEVRKWDVNPVIEQGMILTVARDMASGEAEYINKIKIVKLHDSPCNTLCLCTGSLGSNPANDIPAIIRHFGEMDRIGCLHVRNVKHLGLRKFR
jgi:hypothetical protein